MLEIIATCLDDVVAIAAHGGQRVELVSGLTEGGLTPSQALIRQAVAAVDIPIYVMIRPHGKSFVYSEADIQVMCEDIRVARDAGAAGVVLGALTPAGAIDEAALKRFLAETGTMDVTFHRAIDATADPVAAIDIIRRYPQVTRILSSGGKGQALHNMPVLKAMLAKAGDALTILVGSGLTPANIAEVIAGTGAKEVHFGTSVRTGQACLGDIDGPVLQALAAKVAALLKK